MPKPPDIQRRGLQPDVSRTRVYDQRITDRGTLGERLAELGRVLDPAGSGAVGKYLRARDEEANAAVQASFEADNEVTELSIVQANPHLFGASKVIHRSLAHMRGSKSGLDAINQARITAAGTGLDRQDPEAFALWLNDERQRVLDESSLDSDGQRAFNHAWAERGRALIDQSVPKAMDALEDQFRAERSADYGSLLSDSFATKQYDALPTEFADRLNTATLLGRDRGIEELAVLTDMRAHLVANPSAGSGAIEALIDEGVFTSPAAKLEAAQLSAYADAQADKATIAAAKETEALATAQLDTATAEWINAAITQGQPGVAKLAGKLLELDPGVSDKGRKAYEGALALAEKQSNAHYTERDLIDLDQHILSTPDFDSFDLLEVPGLTTEAAKRGMATIEARDKGLSGLFAFDSVQRGITRLKSQPAATADIAGGAIVDPVRSRLFQEALASYPAAMWDWAKSNPDQALNAEAAGRYSDALVSQIIKDVDALRPPPAPDVTTDAVPDTVTGSGIVSAVQQRYREFEAARQRATGGAVKSGSILGRNPHAEGLYTRAPLYDSNTDMLFEIAAGHAITFHSIQAAPPAQPAAAPADASARPSTSVELPSDPGTQTDDELERVYGPGTAAGVRAIGRALKSATNPVFGPIGSQRS